MKNPMLAAMFRMFALQRAFAMKYPSHAHGTFNYGYIKDGHMFFRSKDKVISTVKEVGGKIINISDDILYPNECHIAWNIYRAVII